MSYSLGALATQLSAKLCGDDSLPITRLSPFDTAQEGDICFVSDKKLLPKLAECKASALVLPNDLDGVYSGNALFMETPYVGYAMLARIFDTTPTLTPATAASATVHPTASIGNNVAIAENVVIGEGVVIGDNTQIHANVVIGENSELGSHCIIYPNVSIYHTSIIGNNVIIHANTVIGSDGFGNAPYQGTWVKIPQLGRVIIADDVEVGSSTTIDRGALGDTIIGKGVKIDNQCHLAHNLQVGDHTAIAGGSNFAGSTKIGKNCIIGGSVTCNGHIELVDGTIVTGNSMVMRSTTKPGTYSSGIPAQENKAWRKNTAYSLKIEDLFKRVKQLEKQIKEQN